MRLKRPETGAWKGNRLKHLSKNPLIKGVVGRFKEHVAVIASTVKPKTILDVGCGEGFNTIVVSKWVPDSKITAIDLEDEYIDYAKKNNNRANITYKKADLYKLAANKKYDLVMCNQVLEHLDDYNKALDMLTERSKKMDPFDSTS